MSPTQRTFFTGATHSSAPSQVFVARSRNAAYWNSESFMNLVTMSGRPIYAIPRTFIAAVFGSP